MRHLYKILRPIKPLIKAILPSKAWDRLRWYVFFKPKKTKAPPSGFYDASLPQGVNLIGILRAGNSIGVLGRLVAQALTAAEIPFCVIDISEYFIITPCNAEYEHKESVKQKYNVNLIAVNADSLPVVSISLDQADMRKRFNIGYWAWELAEFPDIWQSAFEMYKEIWTLSTFCTSSVEKKSPVPVLTVPLHTGKLGSCINNGREYFSIPHNVFLFMIAYDCNSYVERKNPQASVRAFMDAFSPEDRHVGLVLKLSYPENYRSHIKELLETLSEYPNIFYFDKYLSDVEIRTLVNISDTFVSLHRSEGFGLIPLEAMALGTPVIATAWSGNMDYMNHKNAALVDYTLVPVNGQYVATTPEEDYMWAEPDIAEAAEHMRRLVSDKVWREELINNGKATANTFFSAENMGKIIRKRLQALGLLD